MRSLLMNLFDAALRACDAQAALKRAWHLLDPPDSGGRVVICAAGKAAAAMAVEAALHFKGEAQGIAVTRHSHGLRAGEAAPGIAIIEAGHPLPDAASMQAGARMLALVQGLSVRDRVLALLSGGGSALLEAPLPGLSPAAIVRLSDALLSSGAPIHDINCVRKHLSAIKGGRLAAAAAPAKVITFAISDVPGDQSDLIASGPTLGDPSTQADARAILSRHRIAVPARVNEILADPRFETPKTGDFADGQTQFHLIAHQTMALEAAADAARALGLRVQFIRDRNMGEARDVAEADAAEARLLAADGHPLVLIGGGELTVTGARNLSGGSGGPMRAYALSLALALQGHPRIAALCADTDGIDGSADAAGAFVFPGTLERATALGLDVHGALDLHDSGRIFDWLGDALVTGPTRTNVSHLRLIAIGA